LTSYHCERCVLIGQYSLFARTALHVAFVDHGPIKVE
jgi:hypothetical protein